MASSQGSQADAAGIDRSRSAGQGGRAVSRLAAGGADRQTVVASTDPDVLVAEIARTRDELAVTLEAIADRVSPQKVKQRARTRAAEVAADVKARAAQQLGVARTKALAAKERAGQQAAVAKQQVAARAAAAREQVGAHTGSGSGSAGGGSVALDKGTAGPALGDLPPTRGVPVPGLAPGVRPTGPLPDAAGDATGGTGATAGTSRSAGGSHASPGSVATLAAENKEYVAGGAVALLLLLLLRRRRRRRKARAAEAARRRSRR